MSRYYSPTTGGFYSERYRERYEAAGTWPSDAVEITEEQHNALLLGEASTDQMIGLVEGKPALVEPTAQHLARSGLVWRRAQLISSQWLMDRHRDQCDAAASRTLTTSQFQELLRYRQALRDWTATEDFPSTRPKEPTWLEAAKSGTTA